MVMTRSCVVGRSFLVASCSMSRSRWHWRRRGCGRHVVRPLMVRCPVFCQEQDDERSNAHGVRLRLYVGGSLKFVPKAEAGELRSWCQRSTLS
eukprot:7385632-Prymnesium_polylepis.1